MACRKSYSHNKNFCLNNLNNLIASGIPGFEREFLSADSVEEAERTKPNYAVDHLSLLSAMASFPNHKRKDEDKIMLLQNSQPKNFNFNRAQYIIT